MTRTPTWIMASISHQTESGCRTVYLVLPTTLIQNVTVTNGRRNQAGNLSGRTHLVESSGVVVCATNTSELVPKVSAVRRASALTDNEFSDICRRALRAPPLPDPIPAPAHLPALPAEYPESYADYRRRNPGFTPADSEPDRR